MLRFGGTFLAYFPCVLPLGVLWFALSVAPTPLQAQTYTDLHDFNCLVEACQPNYPEIMAQGRDGNLYGTIQGGGPSGLGTIFKVTPSGTVTTLHTFTGPDGSTPYGGLTLGTDGNFYGTIMAGGANNDGTIFKVTPSGGLTTLHSFSPADGTNPHGAPVEGKNGSFYGTTCSQFGPWTGYSITSAGKFKLLTSSIPPCPFDALIHPDIHGKRSRCFRELPVGMPIEMPSAMMETVPHAHGIVAEHNGLTVDRDFRQVVEPREFLSEFANFFVVIAGYDENLLASNLPTALQSPCLASDTEITEEIESAIGLHRGIQAFKDRLIHLLYVAERAIAV